MRKGIGQGSAPVQLCTVNVHLATATHKHHLLDSERDMMRLAWSRNTHDL